MNAQELRTKNDADLAKLLGQERESLRALRFAEAGSRAKNVKAARESRKTIARILTELASRAQIA